MKKTFLFLAALVMSAMMMADVTADTIFLKGFAGSESTTYVSELLKGTSSNGIGVAATNFNPSTAQIKGNQTSATGNFYIYNTEAYPGAITKIEIIAKIDANNYFKNNMYAATGVASQAEVTDVAAGAAWNVETASWTFDETDGVTYFKLYSNEKFTNGSVKEAKVVVTYGGTPTPQKEVVDVRVTDEPTKMEYFVGESFDPAGLTVTAIYDDASTEDVTSKATWTIEPATFTEASESASVSVKAEFNKVKSKPRTITGIVVTAKVVPTGYASVYTSNVELTAGDNSSDAVIKYDGGEYNGVKCGTSSKAGSCTTTIPAATKMLHFHAIGWKGAASTTLTVNGTEYTITPDDGITNNSPFTLVGDAYEYYYTFDPKGATEITFTSGKRFVLFGVNAELQEGVVAAPAFTPTDGYFDGSVEVSLSCETEGADIFYAINEEVNSMNAIQYTEAIPLTATTTIYAVAKKDGKESEQVSKTYSLIPVYTLAELVAAGAPTAEKKKVILTLENEKITGIDGTRGIYVKSGDQEVEIFCYNLPETAVKDGYVSGRAMGDWFLFGNDDAPKKWELQPADWNWANFTTTPTALQNVMLNANIRKAMHNGRIVILKGDKMFNLHGMLVK